MFSPKASSGFTPSKSKGFFNASGVGASENLSLPVVAVLYARRDSIYKTIPGCDVFDDLRDARTFSGRVPVVTHPPCRLWGRLRGLSKAPESERELAFHAVDVVRRNGGVLEHPEASALWPAAGLPRPGAGRDAWGGWTLPILQSWWGHVAPKATFLYVVGVEPKDVPPMPFELGKPAGRIHLMNSKDSRRDGTPVDLANWLVDLALAAGKKESGSYVTPGHRLTD